MVRPIIVSNLKKNIAKDPAMCNRFLRFLAPFGAPLWFYQRFPLKPQPHPSPWRLIVCLQYFCTDPLFSCHVKYLNFARNIFKKELIILPSVVSLRSHFQKHSRKMLSFSSKNCRITLPKEIVYHWVAKHSLKHFCTLITSMGPKVFNCTLFIWKIS